MNLGQLRTYVRSMLDCDESDVTEFMLDAWLQEGSDRVHRFADWPWLDTTWDLSTALTAVDFSEIVDDSNDTPKNIDYVHNGDEELMHQDAQVLLTAQFDETDVRGRPRYWAVRGGRTLLLHPTPSAAEAYVIQGQRAPRDWVAQGATAEPDMPRQLHYAVAHWALGNAYQHLGDGQNANHNFERAQLTLSEVKQDLKQVAYGAPSVMGGGSYRPKHLQPARWIIES